MRVVRLGPEDVRMNPEFFREGLFKEPGRRPLLLSLHILKLSNLPLTICRHWPQRTLKESFQKLLHSLKPVQLIPLHTQLPNTTNRRNKGGRKAGRGRKPSPLPPFSERRESRITLVSQSICLKELSPQDDQLTEIESQICMSQKKPWCPWSFSTTWI